MKEQKFKPFKEWFEQAEYDIDTAKAMFKTGKYIYSVFMCHLAIEKSLKGLWVKQFKRNPLKTHNLNYFCEKMDLDLEENHRDFMDYLNSLSISVRYPDNLKKMIRDYEKKSTSVILKKTTELFLCLKKIIQKPKK